MIDDHRRQSSPSSDGPGQYKKKHGQERSISIRHSPVPTGGVLFLTASLSVGGSEVKSVHLVNELARRGWPVHMGYLNPPDPLLSQLDSMVPAQCFDRHGKISIAAMSRLNRYIQANDVRTIVAMNLYPSIYSTVASLRHRSLKNLVAVNVTQHLSARERIHMAIYAPLLRRANGVIFGCRVQMEQWAADYGLRDECCRVIYNGVDTKRFSRQQSDAAHQLAQRLQYSADDVVVGTVGQLRPEKAQANLIEAVARLRERVPNLRGLIVGSGPERSSLECRIGAAGLDGRVTLLGELRDVRPALELMDVFVLPSVAVETFSNAALEAMAMNRAVILSDVGGAREMVEDRISGRIYPRDSVAALVQILAELAQNAAKRDALGANARQAVEERFSFLRMVGDYENAVASASDQC